ncbi:hypothetical protein AV1_gp19 [Actinomyces phage Av-1]|uniref:Uncharacterized protein n=1 Tax=Actinomyces phage Av-1 TaxID=2880361 RepID=A6XAE2_9CAUD|nr:hypothetical protein AV1_gp19 [Actinomyces phage Av-1]ABR67681.1 hypothetical protein [Actinomyces phage Av-1]
MSIVIPRKWLVPSGGITVYGRSAVRARRSQAAQVSGPHTPSMVTPRAPCRDSMTRSCAASLASPQTPSGTVPTTCCV